MSAEVMDKLTKYLEYQRDMGLEYIPMEKGILKDLSNGGSEMGLNAIQKKMSDCKLCGLSGGRNKIVFGEGDKKADLMFVGEAPGADEDAQGRPFVGRAGKLLTKIIEAMGYQREDVYIANIIKCRPPENRRPAADEVESCIPFLKKQIASIKPKIIVCLGSTAVQNLLQTEEKISALRGKLQEFEGVQVMPTFHPAYLLRNPSAKKEVWKDMKKVLKLIK